jgi:hypothetical protein
MKEHEPEEQEYIICIRNAGWEIDCKLLQTLAADKGILMTCSEYFETRKSDGIKLLVRMLLDAPNDQLKDLSHIIKIKNKQKKSDEPIITDNYFMEKQK